MSRYIGSSPRLAGIIYDNFCWKDKPFLLNEWKPNLTQWWAVSSRLNSIFKGCFQGRLPSLMYLLLFDKSDVGEERELWVDITCCKVWSVVLWPCCAFQPWKELTEDFAVKMCYNVPGVWQSWHDRPSPTYWCWFLWVGRASSVTLMMKLVWFPSISNKSFQVTVWCAMFSQLVHWPCSDCVRAFVQLFTSKLQQPPPFLFSMDSDLQHDDSLKLINLWVGNFTDC